MMIEFVDKIDYNNYRVKMTIKSLFNYITIKELKYLSE